MIQMDHQPSRLIPMHSLAAQRMLLGCETGILQKSAQPQDALLIEVGVMQSRGGVQNQPFTTGQLDLETMIGTRLECCTEMKQE